MREKSNDTFASSAHHSKAEEASKIFHILIVNCNLHFELLLVAIRVGISVDAMRHNQDPSSTHAENDASIFRHKRLRRKVTTVSLLRHSFDLTQGGRESLIDDKKSGQRENDIFFPASFSS